MAASLTPHPRSRSTSLRSRDTSPFTPFLESWPWWWQRFSSRTVSTRYLAIHRALGYTYVVSVFIAAPLASVVAFKLALLPLKVANTMQSFAWIVTTSIALYCVRSGNIVQHRRWMIRSYPFAMVFTVVRAIQAIPAIARLGYSGREAVVWSVIAMAAFLPNIFLEWRSIFPHSVSQ